MPSLGLPIYGQKTAPETRRRKQPDEPEARARPSRVSSRRAPRRRPRGFRAAASSRSSAPPSRWRAASLQAAAREARAVRARAGGVDAQHARGVRDRGERGGVRRRARRPGLRGTAGRRSRATGSTRRASAGATRSVRRSCSSSTIRRACAGSRGRARARMVDAPAGDRRARARARQGRRRPAQVPCRADELADARRAAPRLERFPRARFDAWSATGRARSAGAAIAFGRSLDATYDVAKADVILSLDSTSSRSRASTRATPASSPRAARAIG